MRAGLAVVAGIVTALGLFVLFAKPCVPGASGIAIGGVLQLEGCRPTRGAQ